jgi:hypothetical protein
VEAAVVRVGRYGTNTAHSIQIPWGEYEQRATGIDLPVRIDRASSCSNAAGRLFLSHRSHRSHGFLRYCLTVWERLLNFDLRSKVGCISEIKTKKTFFILYFARFALPLHTKACETAHAACRQKCTNDNDYGISNIHS